jgi:hypothetical protein
MNKAAEEWMDKSGQSATIDTGSVSEGGLSRADSWQEQRSLTAPMRRVNAGRIRVYQSTITTELCELTYSAYNYCW